MPTERNPDGSRRDRPLPVLREMQARRTARRAAHYRSGRDRPCEPARRPRSLPDKSEGADADGVDACASKATRVGATPCAGPKEPCRCASRLAIYVLCPEAERLWPNHHGKEGVIGSSPMLGSSEGGVIGSRLKAQALTAPAVGRPNNVRCHRRSAEVARPFAPVAPDARFDQAPRVALARADPIRSEARTA
jgi:hypothetical protein